MNIDYYLAIGIAGFISAIFLCSFSKIGITFAIFLFFLSIILFLFRKFISIDFESKQKIFLITIFIFSFAFGVARYEIASSKTLDTNLENTVGEKVIISGVVSDEPTRKEKRAILAVNFRNLINASSSLAVFGKGLVSTDLYPEAKYGDLISITGKLEKPENIVDTNRNSTSSGGFDYVSYLGKDNIYYKIDFAKIEIISSGHGNHIKSLLFNIKNDFINNLNKTINEPESSLLSGILLGAKSSIDENTSNIFRSAGLSHIVALSGYNITVVADAIMKILSFLPRNFGFCGGVIGIMLFVLMSGASSTAVRAGMMAFILILAKATRRDYQAGRALVVAGLLMIIINPKVLVFDISFQLSFLATLAIIYVSPVLKNRLFFITDKMGLRDMISTTVSAQMLVLPLILYKMGLLSLVALPANILILAFIPAIMFFGFITGVLGFLWLPLSLPFAWVSWFLLAYVIKVASFFAGLPFSSVNVSWFSLPIAVLCYICVFIWIKAGPLSKARPREIT